MMGNMRDAGTEHVVNVVLVDDSSAHGCTCNEIARTLKAQQPLGCTIKVWVVVVAHWVRRAAALNSHLSDATHREIEEAVDKCAAEGQQESPNKGSFKGEVYIKFDTNAGENLVQGAYGGSTVRKAYSGMDFGKPTSIREAEHARLLQKGAHHCWRMQRAARKGTVHEAQCFLAMESEEGETWERFVRRVIAVEQEFIACGWIVHGTVKKVNEFVEACGRLSREWQDAWIVSKKG